MKAKKQLHPAIIPLVSIVEEITKLVEPGSCATDSFWYRFSVDCHFLEFGKEFSHEREPRVKIRFYPAFLVQGIRGIESIGVITPEIILETDGEGIDLVARPFPRFQYWWMIQNKKQDAARLMALEICRRRGEGSVSYGSLQPDSRDPISDDWSHGVTVGYPWTMRTPETLKGRTCIEGRRIPFTVSVEEKIQKILRLGRFEEFREQLEKQKRKAD